MPMYRLLCVLLLLGSLSACDSQRRAFNAALAELAAMRYDTAAAQLLTLAKNGYPPAQFRYGVLLLYGKGVARSAPQQAAYWFEKAARLEHVGAQWALARLYRSGYGVTQSDTQALRWYTRLAERGFAPACFELAELYEQRKTKNALEQAVGWYHKAAAAGHRAAMLRLAKAYRHGELGLQMDRPQSDYWQQKTVLKSF